MIHKKVENPGQMYRRTKWMRLRKKMLKRFPICQRCNERPSLHCDHKIPVKIKPELRFAEFNLQMLCASCHSQKTRADQNRRPINPSKRGSDENGLPINLDHPWLKEKK